MALGKLPDPAPQACNRTKIFQFLGVQISRQGMDIRRNLVDLFSEFQPTMFNFRGFCQQFIHFHGQQSESLIDIVV